MKTQDANNFLFFNKKNIVELNNDALIQVKGGTISGTFLSKITDIPNFSRNTLCTSDVK